MSSAANSITDDYQYQPLDHTTQQIRLVTLLVPLENDDAIRLDTEIFEVSEAPPYTALSYVWGPPSNNAIYIAEGRLEIRDSLFRFLTEFRKCRDKTPSDRYLWIDQLCIDQSTTSERNHQVQMMADIYSKATSVIAWLTDGSRKLNIMLEVFPEIRRDMFESVYDAACVWRDFREPAALAYVIHDEYFTRLWIVQEFILARQIRILVKDVWLIDDTHGGEYRSEPLDDYLRRFVPRRAHSVIYKSSLRRTGEFIHLDLATVLVNHMGSECADPRDKVYGILGLVRVDQRVTVDYEKSNDQLYMDIILVALQNQCLEESAEAISHEYRGSTLWSKAALMMDITWARQASFRSEFWKIWLSDTLGRFRGHACPITAIGLEKAAMTGCEVDRFWFDFQGTRHFLDCTSEETALADETERLLHEDWEKHVPRDHAEETS